MQLRSKHCPPGGPEGGLFPLVLPSSQRRAVGRHWYLNQETWARVFILPSHVVWISQSPGKQGLCRYFSSRNLTEETGYKNVARVKRANGMWGNPEVRYNRKPRPPVGWKDRGRRWWLALRNQGSPAGTLRETESIWGMETTEETQLLLGMLPKAEKVGEILWFLLSSHLPISCLCLLLAKSN